MANIFKGYKQVLASTYNSTSNADKVGYLWLVRESVDTEYADIYFGTRHYGHFGSEAEDIVEIKNILSDAGIIDESGNTVDIATLISDAMLEGGIAISLSGKTVSVNVADETENAIDDVNSTKNFIKVNDDNELEVKGVDADATVTSSDIIIEGGPLAELAKKAYTSGTLPSGTTIQDFLLSMLCVEKWSNTPTQTNTFTATVSAPSFTIKKSSDNTSVAGKSVEIGTKVKVSAMSPNSSSATQKINVATMTYGYKVGSNGEKTTSTSYEKVLTPNTTSTDRTVKANYGTLKTASGDTFVSTADVVKVNESVPEIELYVPNGTAKVTSYQSGYTYASNTSYTSEDIYISTNLSNYYKEDKATDNVFSTTNPWSTAVSKTATNSTSLSVTGARAFFYGWRTTGNAVAESDIDSDIVRGLQSSGLSISKTTYNLTNTSKASQFIIAFPSSLNYKVSKVLDGGALDAAITDNFEKVVVSVESANAYDSVNYDVWYYTPTGNAWDPRTLKITIA